MILYTCSKGTAGKEPIMDMEKKMTDKQFKSILEMVTMIIEGSKDKEEAVEKIKSLSIFKEDKPKEKN
jgi:hypothetical protein